MIEIDGPQLAYFEYDGNRITYTTLAIIGNNPNKVVKFFFSHINKIKEFLGEKGIIYWRVRPELSLDYTNWEFFNSGDTIGQKGKELEFPKYKMYGRLATFPELSKDFWDTLCVKQEGTCCKELEEDINE